MKKHKSPGLAADGIIFEKGKILLVKRNHYPFVGYWVLPGGHVEYGERVEAAVIREMKEELGIASEIKKLVGIYSDPKRDPREHIVSAVYWLKIKKGEIKLNSESSDFKYFPLDNLPSKIGFDHRRIIRDFKKCRESK